MHNSSGAMLVCLVQRFPFVSIPCIAIIYVFGVCYTLFRSRASSLSSQTALQFNLQVVIVIVHLYLRKIVPVNFPLANLSWLAKCCILWGFRPELSQAHHQNRGQAGTGGVVMKGLVGKGCTRNISGVFRPDSLSSHVCSTYPTSPSTLHEQAQS